MDITKIITELKSERTRIDHAITAIESLNHSTSRRRGRPAGASAPKRRRRRISAAARRKLSRLLKQRWAKGKMKPKQAKASKPARRISAAGRKRIAQATKRRWAEWRRMKKKPVGKAA
jgi:hypothetical protein